MNRQATADWYFRSLLALSSCRLGILQRSELKCP
jgi:hypothetical protein